MAMPFVLRTFKQRGKVLQFLNAFQRGMLVQISHLARLPEFSLVRLFHLAPMQS
jgi:hypothetical protein